MSFCILLNFDIFLHLHPWYRASENWCALRLTKRKCHLYVVCLRRGFVWHEGTKIYLFVSVITKDSLGCTMGKVNKLAEGGYLIQYSDLIDLRHEVGGKCTFAAWSLPSSKANPLVPSAHPAVTDWYYRCIRARNSAPRGKKQNLCRIGWQFTRTEAEEFATLTILHNPFICISENHWPWLFMFTALLFSWYGCLLTVLESDELMWMTLFWIEHNVFLCSHPSFYKNSEKTELARSSKLKLLDGRPVQPSICAVLIRVQH